MEQPTGQAQSASANSLFGDFSKLIEQFKLPGIDVHLMMEARRKDLEALAAANRTAVEGVQALGRKQTEILRTTLEEVQSLVKHLTPAGSGGSSASATEVVQQALQKTFTNMRELAESAYKSQSDAFAIVNQRVQENIREVESLLRPKK